MTHLKKLFVPAVAAVLLMLAAGCGDEPAATNGGHDDDHEHVGKHGGQIVESSDHEAHFEIVHDPAGGVAMLYLYDGKMKPTTTATAPVLNLGSGADSVAITGTAGSTPSNNWAFVHDALKEHVHGRFRVDIGGRTYTPEFDPGHEDGHEHGDDDHGDHEHGPAHGPHDGTVAALKSGERAGGFVELKLHDDKGDLELWISENAAITQPLDLPLDATVTVTFVDRGNKQVTLRVRNRDRNEDEDGKPNNREGKTNYFIFPGETGADASWLMGADFSADVRVSFTADGGTWSTEAFGLRPHTHGHGHEHD